MAALKNLTTSLLLRDPMSHEISSTSQQKIPISEHAVFFNMAVSTLPFLFQRSVFFFEPLLPPVATPYT